jgi:tripartite-type tricarboxylate transporter receptor subunit TctC
MLTRRAFALAVTTSAIGGGDMARAQSYPTRPITLDMPFAAGGPGDTLARILAEHMKGSLGQTVVVENVTGAAGSIGAGRVARAPPDGYSVLLGNWTTHVANPAIYSLPYDVTTDFEPIALVATQPVAIVSNKKLPATNLKELIAWLEANPGKASAGSSGVGSASYMAGLFFGQKTKTRFQLVPYRGAALAMQDMIAGQTDMLFDLVANSLPQLRAGAIRAYGLTANTRLGAAPDIPTVDEAGLPEFYIALWNGTWAPRGTPRAIIDKLNAAVRAAVEDPAVRAHLADLGHDVFPREEMTPEALARFQKAEIEKWWPVIKAANIKGE